MDSRFLVHNSHIEDPTRFATLDPQMRRLERLPLVHRPRLLAELPSQQPGIYAVTGGRQTGKSTLVKQWMARLLGSGIPPANVRYLTGELIDDHHSLVRHATDALSEATGPGFRFLAVDEVTYVSGWDRGIKYLADAGMLDNVVLLVTGSDSVLIRDLVATLPGRRGRACQTDYHVRPLSFREVVELKGALSPAEVRRLADPEASVPRALVERLHRQFDAYLEHGGFLTAINDLAATGGILVSTLATYSDWIRGDMLKRGKQERYLREVLEAVRRRTGSHVSWNALAKELSIDHPATVASYVSLLESMEVLLVQAALQEHSLSPAPKKARKLMFTDPFIQHAVTAWLSGAREDPYQALVVPTVRDPESASRLAEACAVAHHARNYPTYYIKGDRGEVDIAYVAEGSFLPVEVKWTSQIRPADLKQVSRYPRAVILDRANVFREVLGIPTIPLPVALFRLG